LKQATVDFFKEAVGGIACASLVAHADAQNVLFSVDKGLKDFSLTRVPRPGDAPRSGDPGGRSRTYPLVNIREILVGKDSARFLESPTASTVREEELGCVVDIQLTSGVDEHVLFEQATDAHRFVQAMSVLRLYRVSQR
jgi:hypothetical protein